MKISERIRLARTGKNMTQEALGKSLGVTRGAVAQWESGKTRPRHDTIRAISIVTEKSEQWLEYGIEEDHGMLMVTGIISGDTWRSKQYQFDQYLEPLIPLPLYPRIYQHLWKVQGNSCDLVAQDGDYLHAIAIEATNLPPQNNDLLVIKRTEQGKAEYTVRRLVLTPLGLVLRLENSDYTWTTDAGPDDILLVEMENVEIVDLVLAKWRPYSHERYFDKKHKFKPFGLPKDRK